MDERAREIHSFVADIVGLPCWHVSIGVPEASWITFYLGRKLPRRVSVDYALLNEEARRNIPELEFTLVHCVSRVDAPHGPVAYIPDLFLCEDMDNDADRERSRSIIRNLLLEFRTRSEIT